MELPASAGNASGAAALLPRLHAQEIPGRLSVLAEGSRVTGRREMYLSQHTKLVTLFIRKVF